MFEVAEVFLIQFIEWLPFLIPLILIFNLASDLLWSR